MAEPASISTSIAGRYAKAVFEIAQEQNALADLESGVNDLAAVLDSSADMRAMITSPMISRDEQQGAIAAIASKMSLVPVLANTLSLMAQKRRLFVLPQLVKSLREQLAAHRGEVTADVASATALTKPQQTRLVKALSSSVGKTVTLNTTVDETLIGGLVVKVGSRMIDTSIRSRLNSLQNAMKEVG